MAGQASGARPPCPPAAIKVRSAGPLHAGLPRGVAATAVVPTSERDAELPDGRLPAGGDVGTAHQVRIEMAHG